MGKMLSEKNYIEKIRQEINESRTSRLWEDSLHMLSTVSESIFSRSAHFILEILQNAEDAGSRTDSNQGQLEFHISPSRIKITHTASPFTEEDVNAICGVRSQKRPEQGTLGYLGIGFKSVFKISDSPQIFSGGFRFKFSKDAYEDPDREPWQIIPIWLDEAPEPVEDKLTTFILPFRNAQMYQQTLEELQKLDVHVFLFLKWLRKIRLVDDVSGETTVIENLGQQDKIVTLRKDGVMSRFVIFRRNCSVPQEVASDPALQFYKRQTVKQREVVLAFGVDDEEDLQPLDDASALGSVSSFLPLVEERSGAKFLIQADFLVQPGREAIQYELSWNHWLISQAVEVAKEAITEFVNHPRWRTQFLTLFNFKAYTGQPAFEKLFYPKLIAPLIEHLESAEIYPTASGANADLEHTVFPCEHLKDLLTDADLPLLFGGRTDLHLADANMAIDVLPPEVRDKTKKLDIGQAARHKELLEKKRDMPNAVDWFINFYSAMAEKDSYFKTVPARDRRGRITHVDSPIYVLTDKEMIASANEVYFREIPEEVLQLRHQFREVDSLLGSYQLLHPRLEIPELVSFFREKTHVQSIDYDKICRQVFLPRVSVQAETPPPKDELVAYTRLLQKGPPVQEQIWVVTKNSGTRPSDQVFFGAEYSPSENWEKFAQFSPQINFLSGEYLQGVSDLDVAAWKKFFVNLGVKERADNPYVEQFAMAFVKDHLASQLANFTPKNRQQHGYDLEARQVSNTSSVVYLEIKGQKSERPVELIGLEPKTAKAAKENYWLCIVPGIPENPQLWVVENPSAVGDYNIITIDVSKWKASGKRVV